MRFRFLAVGLVAVAGYPLAAAECPPHPWCERANIRTWCKGDLPSVSGVSIGTTLDGAKGLLGVPVNEMPPQESGFDGILSMDLVYEGLVLGAIKDEGEDQFTITRIESNSSTWQFHQCASVGNSREEALEELGPPDRINSEGGREVLVYFHCPADEYTALTIEGGTVVGVLIWLDWM